MERVDPHLMRLFCCRIANPVVACRVYKVLSACTYHDLRHPAGAYSVVDRLAHCCDVRITPAQREYGARWLMNCGVDPANPSHRHAMRGLLNSY